MDFSDVMDELRAWIDEMERSGAKPDADANKVYSHVLSFAPVTARFVKVKALSEHCMPAWHGSAGKAGFLFVDEIIVK